jgi:hypothetical protein
MHKETKFLRDLIQPAEIMCTRLEIQRTRIRGWHVEPPVVIERHGIHPRGLDLLHDVDPELWDGDTEWMELAAEGEEALAVVDEAVVVPLDGFVAESCLADWPFCV